MPDGYLRNMRLRRQIIVRSALFAAACCLVLTAVVASRIPHLRVWLAHSNWDMGPDGYASAIDYPHAREINLGMTRKQVRGLLGAPTYIIHATDKSTGAREVWTYEFFGWAKGITVIFDASGVVVHRSWGMG